MPDNLDKRVCKVCEKPNEAKITSCVFCGAQMPETISIVISYSHKNKSDIDDLLVHLAPLRREKLVDIWYDEGIEAGREWETSISDRFKTADVILLLITPNFIASDYCYSLEMDWALKRHDAHEVCLIPVIFRTTTWNKTPIHRIQALPANSKPVVTWAEKDEALVNVTQGIRRAIKGRYHKE